MTKDNNTKLNSLEFLTNKIIASKILFISKIACDILVIPSTSASSERIFSISGDCLNGLRNLLVRNT